MEPFEMRIVLLPALAITNLAITKRTPTADVYVNQVGPSGRFVELSFVCQGISATLVGLGVDELRLLTEFLMAATNRLAQYGPALGEER